MVAYSEFEHGVENGQFAKKGHTLQYHAFGSHSSLRTQARQLAICVGLILGIAMKHMQFFARNERPTIQIGTRPASLVSLMRSSNLKEQLTKCVMDPYRNFQSSDFSVSHRGAPLQYPEHTMEGYLAGILMGAGIMECDVVFTKDFELVCRHAQCDLHRTTNILVTPLAQKCSQPFEPANPALGTSASAECCASDITLDEFRTLKGKMDGANLDATTPEEYLQGTPSWRTDLYAINGTLMSHADSIAFFKKFNTKFAPELKKPSVPMPFNGFSLDDLLRKIVDEYLKAGVDLRHVRLQSKELEHIVWWSKRARPAETIYLDERYDLETLSKLKPSEMSPSMDELRTMGVDYIAPPTWMLVTSRNGHMVPSGYAIAAKNAGLKLITWTLERTPPLAPRTQDFYYQSVRELITNDGDVLELLHVLAQQVGVVGVFSDWPATTTFYANCMGL